jgi:hypothetical protein
MAPDGKSVLPGGKVIVEDAKALPVLEGPKLYKRNGWYYIFAPIGGVETGPQAVLRSRDIWGPYEHRVVLAPGKTAWKGRTRAAGSRPRPARAGSSISTAPAPMAGSSTCSRCPGRTTGR